MDFGFFSPNDGGNKWLREELVYPGTHIYYAIIFEDVALRLAWVVGLALSKVIKAYLFLVHLIKNSTGSTPYKILNIVSMFNLSSKIDFIVYTTKKRGTKQNSI